LQIDSETWTALSAIGTLLGAIASAVVCWATFRILRATQQTLSDARAEAERTRRPVIEVSAWPKPGQPVVMLSARNTGNGAARNVKLTLDRDFYFNAHEGESNNLKNYNVFRERIASLTPRTEIDLMLGLGHVIFKNPERCPLQFMVEARYSFEGKEYAETTFIDIAPFSKHSAAEDPQLAQLKRLVAAAEMIAASTRQGTTTPETAADE
jgi:hypothetical protein